MNLISLAGCQKESERLENWVNWVQPVMISASEDAEKQEVISETVALLHHGIVVNAVISSWQSQTGYDDGEAGEEEDEDDDDEERLQGAGARDELKRMRKRTQAQLKELERRGEAKSKAQREQMEGLRKRNEEQMAALRRQHEEEVARLQRHKESEMERLTREKSEAFTEAEKAARARILQQQRTLVHNEVEVIAQQKCTVGNSWLELLRASDEEKEVYRSKHGLPAPGTEGYIDPETASEEQIAEMRNRIRRLDEIEEYLQERCESDGLVVALRAYCDEMEKTPAQLIRVIFDAADHLRVKMPRRDYWDPDPAMPFELLRVYLQAEGIAYTPEGMSYFLQGVGLTYKQAKKGQLFKCSQFCLPFAEEPQPINL